MSPGFLIFLLPTLSCELALVLAFFNTECPQYEDKVILKQHGVFAWENITLECTYNLDHVSRVEWRNRQTDSETEKFDFIFEEYPGSTPQISKIYKGKIDFKTIPKVTSWLILADATFRVNGSQWRCYAETADCGQPSPQEIQLIVYGE